MTTTDQPTPAQARPQRSKPEEIRDDRGLIGFRCPECRQSSGYLSTMAHLETCPNARWREPTQQLPDLRAVREAIKSGHANYRHALKKQTGCPESVWAALSIPAPLNESEVGAIANAVISELALLTTLQAAPAEEPDGCRTAFEKRHWPTIFQDREMMKRMRGKEPYSSSYREWRTAWQLALASIPKHQPPAPAHPGGVEALDDEDWLHLASAEFNRLTPKEWHWSEDALEAACKAYHRAALSALPHSRDDGGLVEELQAELRHFKGRPAVDGKPLELQSRDELLAHVRVLEAENERLSFEANAGRQAEAEADAEAKELVEALEFYANPANWWTQNSGSFGYHQTNQDGSMERHGAKVGTLWLGNFIPDAGDTARHALARHNAQQAAGAV